MKKFDLELAKQGHPVCTRDGKPARIICFDRKSEKYPIVALVDQEEEEYSLNYAIDGHYYTECEDPHDLMMAPEKREGWINICKTMCYGDIYCIYKSKEEAEKANPPYSTEYMIPIKIEWEE